MKNEIIQDMPIEDYHAHKAVSRSGLMEIARSPQHYWWRFLSGKEEQEDSEPLRIGKAFHYLLMEPKAFADNVLVWSGKPRNTKDGKAEYEEAQEKADGRTLIKRSDFDRMQDMAASILAQPAARQIIAANGTIEPSLFWHDERHDVHVKARPDYWRADGIVLDLKTTLDASREAFEKSIVNYGYDIQAFMQMEAVERCTGKRPDNFVFICVEKEPPHAVAFYVADKDMLDCGAYRYNKLIGKYANCLRSGAWPGYGHLVQPISVPSWFLTRTRKDEENEFMEENNE